MGIDTKLYVFLKVDGKVSNYEIADLLSKNLEANRSNLVKALESSALVNIKNNRTIFIMTNSWKLNIEQFPEQVIKDRLPIYFSLGQNDEAVKIMKEIARLLIDKHDVICYIQEDDHTEDWKIYE